MFLLCRLDFAFYTRTNCGGHDGFPLLSCLSRIDTFWSNSSGVLEAVEASEASHRKRCGVQISLVLREA